MSAGHLDASQPGFAFRFGWGLEALESLAPDADVVVVVDVLRFTTAVSAAVEAGAIVIPFRWRDERAAAHAAAHDAVLAGRREDGGPSLSPTDLLRLRPGTRIVLPSPNGSTIAATALERGVPVVLAGCLRNATATARRALSLAGTDGTVAVIAAGERWSTTDGSLRPALEDLLGAGAVLAALDPSGSVSTPSGSPEAQATRAAFLDARPFLHESLTQTASGRELIGIGCGDDVAVAAELDITERAAQLIDGAFVGV